MLTNGGGAVEERRAAALTTQLGTDIKPSQVIQAHTVVKAYAQKYAGKSVYGFDAYTSLDILAWNKDVSPLHRLSELERSTIRPADFSTTPLHAVFVFHDPRNWFLDTQILSDVLRGVYLDPAQWRSMQAEHGANPVKLIFCNPDLIWRAEFTHPRLGQGGFITAFQSVFKAQFGQEHPFTQYGKPHKPTYDFAKTVLRKQLADIERTDVDRVDLPPIYMIGDNPESDIAGANGAGWESILVHTGVYNPESGIPPSHSPTHQAKDVAEAVRWAFDREVTRARA